MAGIDKTYVNKSQWLQAKEFWDATLDQQTKELGEPIYLYSKTVDEIGDDSVLWNTSFIEDVWLKKNCKLDFVLQRLGMQYGGVFNKGLQPASRKSDLEILAERCTFEWSDISIIQIDSGEKITICFHYDDDGETVFLDSTDTVLVYGTTLFFKTVQTAIDCIRGRNYDGWHGEIILNYFGCNLKWANDRFTLVDDPTIEITDIGWVNNEMINLPKFKYSFWANDIKKFRPELVYFSTENEIYPLDSFIDYSEFLATNRISPIQIERFGIPNYILKLIK